MQRIVAAILCASILLGAFNIAIAGGTCTGSDTCTACKNCNSCKHCADRNGTCSVCKPKS